MTHGSPPSLCADCTADSHAWRHTGTEQFLTAERRRVRLFRRSCHCPACSCGEGFVTVQPGPEYDDAYPGMSADDTTPLPAVLPSKDTAPSPTAAAHRPATTRPKPIMKAPKALPKRASSPKPRTTPEWKDTAPSRDTLEAVLRGLRNKRWNTPASPDGTDAHDSRR